MNKQIFYLIASIIILSSISCSQAAISDLYDFNISKTAINSSSQTITEPKIHQAAYRFTDENNNSIYDYLFVEPQGSIRIYDAFDGLVIATESSKIDLKLFYSRKAEGPYRIVVDFNSSIYEATTGNETYSDFEHPQLPDLSVEIKKDSITVKNDGADAFDFFISIYEGENRTLHQKMAYLKSGEEYALDYNSTQDTKAFVDFENMIEETNEENNLAESISSASVPKDMSVSKTASFGTIFKNALQSNESDPVESAREPAQKENSANNSADYVAKQSESKKSNLLTGNVGLNIDEQPNKIASFMMIAASTFLLLYAYDFIFKRRRF